MSGADSTASEAGASAVTRQAADWVSAKRGPGDWPDERQAELDAWLQNSLSHRVAYLRVDAAWQRAERLAALRTPMRPISSSSANRTSFWRRIAVVFGLAAVLGVFASQFIESSNSQLIETPKGGQERVTLADGSQIELNTNTAVRVDFRPRARSVQLVRGEAYFEIRHDAARPFTVTVRDRRIVDLGTKFVVRMAPQEIKVSLLEGKASLENMGANASRPIVLSPGDIAVANAHATHVLKETSHALADSLAWRQGAVVFHYKSLGDAVAELNRYGGPQLVVADARTSKLLISGTFLTNRPEDFAGIAHEIFGVRVERHEGSLILSR